jgi:hypothetical protein
VTLLGASRVLRASTTWGYPRVHGSDFPDYLSTALGIPYCDILLDPTHTLCDGDKSPSMAPPDIFVKQTDFRYY